SKETVTHSPVQGRGFRIRSWQVAIKRVFDQLLASDEIGFDVHSPRSMLNPGCYARRLSNVELPESTIGVAPFCASTIRRRFRGGDGLGAHGQERAEEKDGRAPDLGVSETFSINPGRESHSAGRAEKL